MAELIFCLMGPTASGKTALACELVELFPMEIISVDSAMIYRGMDIGTAKPDARELVRAPHHLLDIIDPCESFSAAQFCEEAHSLIGSIRQRGKIPLLVGGTMMYFHALQQGLSTLPEADETIRERLLQQARQTGWPAMHEELAKIDAASAARIHPNDTQRLQRALEVYWITGKPLSYFLARQKSQNNGYRFINMMLFPDERAWLHERIAIRFKAMLAQGLVNEVRQLINQWTLTAQHPAMRCVGYRQVCDYLAGQFDEHILCDKGIAATRQLAKRQLTWLRHWSQGTYFSCDKQGVASDIVANIAEILDNNRLEDSGS
ncbi:tRNA (adenosine(37)-N6)-dimethylallyltransferase MiaA [Legionella spiritensis]|uniref:tRNA dimethylallyltransferase n=1 Tax=Legionella spiritensis TaxID=452 RepID=A0A0W0Z652_LEGSP|nr:tRNA (adenosine(37)-N6)-dimethylallyltransferase MiaA [Legionella spiritensis]KTD64382.1 tRNA delta(2)-isopentenylpyrophosphate transferase [Legionella spiritensis]SNV46195.1 tRNA delta(2)-isopentenylpyrophosphate transferase [Legionella spiritensis]